MKKIETQEEWNRHQQKLSKQIKRHAIASTLLLIFSILLSLIVLFQMTFEFK